MKYRDCFIRLEALNSIVTLSFEDLKDMTDKNDYIPSVKFLYAITKNKQRLLKITEDLQEVTKETPEYAEYLKIRQELSVKFAQKNSAGQPKIENAVISGQMMQRYVIDGVDDENSTYNKEFNKLKEKFKNAIDEMDRRFESYNKMLDEQCNDYEPYMIEEKEIPKGLSLQVFEALIHCIKEEEPSNGKAKKTK